jgi:DNA-binding GntR family transcriptional regulator
MNSRTATIDRVPDLGTQIAKALKSAILLGYLTFDVTLTQSNLCERVKMSRMPVRDVLARLTDQGLIGGAEQGLLHPIALSPDDIADLFRVEAQLASLAARSATERATEGDLARIRELHTRMTKAVLEEDMATAAASNRLFHREINLAARALMLVSALRTTFVHVHREFLMEFPQCVRHSLTEHEAILAALERRTASKVATLMPRRVEHSGEEVARGLAQSRSEKPY